MQKSYQANAPRQTKMDRQINTEKKQRRHNSTYPKGGVSCSKDSFVVNQTLVFQIKFCGKSPALRVAANRYTQAVGTTKINLFLAAIFIIFVV